MVDYPLIDGHCRLLYIYPWGLTDSCQKNILKKSVGSHHLMHFIDQKELEEMQFWWIIVKLQGTSVFLRDVSFILVTMELKWKSLSLYIEVCLIHKFVTIWIKLKEHAIVSSYVKEENNFIFFFLENTKWVCMSIGCFFYTGVAPPPRGIVTPWPLFRHKHFEKTLLIHIIWDILLTEKNMFLVVNGELIPRWEYLLYFSWVHIRNVWVGSLLCSWLCAYNGIGEWNLRPKKSYYLIQNGPFQSSTNQKIVLL